MSEIHIYDPQVRPESLCGYTGPPGPGTPTCAACLAVDEALVFPTSRWDRVRENWLTPLAALVALASFVAFVAGLPAVVWGAAVTVSLLAGVGVPATVLVEHIQLRRRRGKFVESGV